MTDKTLQDQIDKLMELHPDLFPTEAKFWSYLRGCLRRGLWEKSPMKFKFKEKTSLKPPDGYKGRGKKGHICGLTGEWSMTSKNEVDHLDGHKPLLSEEDIIPYIIHLLATEDDLQVVNKEAHKVKSYAERMGISFEEALLEKQVIAYMKKPVKELKELLTENGLECSNSDIRKRGIRELIQKGVIE